MLITFKTYILFKKKCQQSFQERQFDQHHYFLDECHKIGDINEKPNEMGQKLKQKICEQVKMNFSLSILFSKFRSKRVLVKI